MLFKRWSCCAAAAAIAETTQYRALRRLRATDPQTAAVIKEADSIEASPPRFRAPWYPVLLILDRQLILHVALGLVAFGSYYCSVTELPINLGSPAYGLSPSKVGLCYLPIGVAGMLACPLGGKVSDICGRVNPSQPLRKVLPSNSMLLLCSLHVCCCMGGACTSICTLLCR